jgi:Zn-finger nucleic acid-binding protein
MDKLAGLCPAGHGLLTRAQTHVGSGFFVERCSTCFGIWLDRGEWQVIAGAGLGAGLFAIWSELWQRDRLRARSAQAYEGQLLDELGAGLISKINDLADALGGHPKRSLALGYLLGRLRDERHNVDKD